MIIGLILIFIGFCLGVFPLLETITGWQRLMREHHEHKKYRKVVKHYKEIIRDLEKEATKNG